MDTELQFDQAAPAAACSSCQGGLHHSYFQANGHVLCERCAEGIRNAFQGQCGGFLRFLKATAFGIGGGLAGGAVYTAVLAIAHIQAALITILIGYLVGKGISKGCGGRGGLVYQILAVLITYLTIGFSGALSDVLTRDLAGGSLLKGTLICISGSVFGAFDVGTSDILGGLIIFFGLFQAWKSNKAVRVEVTGPHALAPTITGPTAPALPTPSNTPPSLPQSA